MLELGGVEGQRCPVADHAAAQHRALQPRPQRGAEEHLDRQVQADEAGRAGRLDRLVRDGAPEEHEVAGPDRHPPAVEQIGRGPFQHQIQLDLAVLVRPPHHQHLAPRVGADDPLG
jgi:hypothetical protein